MMLYVYMLSASLLNEERHEVDTVRSVRIPQHMRQSSLAQRENGSVIVKNGNIADASSTVDQKKEKIPLVNIRSSEVCNYVFSLYTCRE